MCAIISQSAVQAFLSVLGIIEHLYQCPRVSQYRGLSIVTACLLPLFSIMNQYFLLNFQKNPTFPMISTVLEKRGISQSASVLYIYPSLPLTHLSHGVASIFIYGLSASM